MAREGPGEAARAVRVPGPVDGDGRWWALRGSTALCAAFALVAAEHAGQTDGKELGLGGRWSGGLVWNRPGCEIRGRGEHVSS